MSAERSIPDLTKDVAVQLGDLVRNELRLARAEAGDELKTVMGAAIEAALGLAFASAAITLILLAIAYGFAVDMPAWMGALIAAALGAAVSAMLIMGARKKFSQGHLALPRTTRQVSQDLHSIKETITS